MFIIGDDVQINDAIMTAGMRGTVKRDVTVQPVRMAAVNFPIIPMEEWPERIAEGEAKKSNLHWIRRRGNAGANMPVKDQNGQGFCWAYSTARCVELLRAKANQPYVPLSAHSVACKIKGFQDEGAWGALSQEFIAKNGIVPESLWPAKSMNRKYDTAENWEIGKDYRISELWADFAEDVWDRTLTIPLIGTQLLLNNSGAFDYNWWGHSVCGHTLRDVHPDRSKTDPSRYGVEIDNSWTPSWGDDGSAVLVDSKAWPNGVTFNLSVMGA